MCARERLRPKKLEAAFLALHTTDPNHSKTVLVGGGETRMSNVHPLLASLHEHIDQKHAAAYSFFSIHAYIQL